MKMLFIGGDYDGQWIEIAGMLMVAYLPYKDQATVSAPLTRGAVARGEVPRLTYKLHVLSAGGQDYPVYALEDLGRKAVLQALILGYHAEPKQEFRSVWFCTVCEESGLIQHELNENHNAIADRIYDMHTNLLSGCGTGTANLRVLRLNPNANIKIE